METPLITEEGSSSAYGGGEDGAGNGGRRSKQFHRRSDAIAYGTRYQKAAALVDLAEDGVGIPEEVLNDTTFERAAKFYFIFIRFDFLWSLNLFALVLLNFLEVIFLVILACDALIYALYLSPVSVTFLPFRLAPYIRVAFITLTVRELRMCILTLAGMFGMYLNVLALSLLFLLFASWLAYVTFEDTQQGWTVFTSYGATLYQMFVLFTTSNNPDVWIPAYKNSRWSSLFFVLYVLLAVYFLTNLILAVVYESFKGQLAKQIVEMDSVRKSILEKAFSLIDNYFSDMAVGLSCVAQFNDVAVGSKLRCSV
uniref:Ion transport domain-containing protein n=1 Tax=Ananas comosus var. bracteatus TaxID=296719 RepID=A0A6V7PUI3_ANACO|nr:unnamed protein product [Ananas comosus var. bracteatus]